MSENNTKKVNLLKNVAVRDLRFKTGGFFHTCEAGEPAISIKQINQGKEVDLKEHEVTKMLKNLGVAAGIWFIPKADFEAKVKEAKANTKKNKEIIKSNNI